MSAIRTVLPVEGRRIRDPADKRNRPLPDTGKPVTWSSYWQRALDAGDITVEAAAPPAAAPAAPAKAAITGNGAPPEPPSADQLDRA